MCSTKASRCCLLTMTGVLGAGGHYMSSVDSDDDDDADSTVSELSTAPGHGGQQGVGATPALAPLRNGGLSLSTSTSDTASLQVC